MVKIGIYKYCARNFLTMINVMNMMLLINKDWILLKGKKLSDQSFSLLSSFIRSIIVITLIIVFIYNNPFLQTTIAKFLIFLLISFSSEDFKKEATVCSSLFLN